LDSPAPGPGEEPLSTDFTASNLGVPRNPAVQFYFEAAPDKRGYSPNQQGTSYTDLGVGFFLRKLKSLSGQLNLDSDWIALAPEFDGKFKFRGCVMSICDRVRNSSRYTCTMVILKSLKEAVHFYNTRDVLPVCKPYDHGERSLVGRRPNIQSMSTRSNSVT
jgi:cytochrome c peroxidase